MDSTCTGCGNKNTPLRKMHSGRCGHELSCQICRRYPMSTRCNKHEY